MGNTIGLNHPTGHGIIFQERIWESDASYGGNREDPFPGLCQVKGGGPGFWMYIRAFVINLLRKWDNVILLKTAI